MVYYRTEPAYFYFLLMAPFKEKLIFIAVIIGVFSSAFYHVRAAEALSEFGGSCQKADDCAGTLKCGGGKCVGCIDNQDCIGGDTCANGICLKPGGNLEGALCSNNTNCLSGYCDSQNRCRVRADPLGDFPGYDLTIESIRKIILGITCWTLSVILAIMVITLIIAGIRFFISRGEAGAVTKAKENLKWVIIGIAVIMATNVIIATVADVFGGDYSYLPLSCESVNTGRTNQCLDTECVRRHGEGHRCIAVEGNPSAPSQCGRARIF